MTASAPRRLVTAAAVPGALCPVSGQGLGPAMAHGSTELSAACVAAEPAFLT